jgi:hypothetical protein
MIRLGRNETSDKSLFDLPHLSGGTQPAYSVCTGSSLPGSKDTGREADHSSASSVVVKNEWSHTSTATHNFMPCRGTTLPVYGTGLKMI